tara:strand:+ start:28 stop:780 length:753 start_codon:yes stop_codon:yes gene_type:complete
MAKRLFRIDTGINGGELVIGTVDEEFVRHFIDKDESDLIHALHDAEHDPDEYCGPEICEDFYTWSETDDIEHLYGVYADSEWSWVELPAGVTEGTRDSMEDEYEGEKFSPLHLHDREAYHDDNDEGIDDYPNCTYKPVLLYHTGEKGGMGCWFIETDGEDFDPNKFCYSTVATNVTEIVDQAWYDKEEVYVDQSWCDTRSKGDYVQVGWMNMDWHDTREQRLADEYMWESYDENIEDARQEELKRSILTK